MISKLFVIQSKEYVKSAEAEIAVIKRPVTSSCNFMESFSEYG